MTTTNTNVYGDLGVSSDKHDVHEAIKLLNKGLFPDAFCKVLPDLAGDSEYCMIMHADGTGTKSSLAYAYWRETGDISVFRNIPQDAIVMNLDDLLCVGATGPFYVDQTINRNKFNVPGEVVTEIIRGTEEYFVKLRKHNVPIFHAGGETADVGDVVQTLIIDNSIVTRMKRADVIDRSRIAPGNIIVGLTSFGKSTYEDEYNSGIGSNGLTLARHGLFGSYLGEKYPELYDHKNLSKDKVFFGSGRLDQIPEGEELPLGKLVLSPTRTYAPVMLSFFQKVDRSKLTGIIHCSGGGQLKCKEKISNVHIVKNNLFPPPFIFKALYATGKMDEREMYMDLNMGSRMEVYCADEETAQLLIATAKEFNVEARKIGYCEKFEDKNLTKKVTITSWLGNTITYAW